jgi:hypothetical protein
MIIRSSTNSILAQSLKRWLTQYTIL